MLKKRLTILHQRKSLIVIGVIFFCASLGLFLYGCSPNQKADPQPESEEPSPTPIEDVVDVAPTVPEPVYVLLLGDDSWGTYIPGRSDLMMLMRLDFQQSIVTLVTIPRDTAYQYDNGETIKANFAYLYGGPTAACKAASTITGIEVDKYIVVGFDGLQTIAERFNGITMNLPYSLTYSFYTKDYPDETFAAGEQVLTPWRSMVLSRARTGYSQYGLNEDMMRQVIDRQMFMKLAEQLFSLPVDKAGVIKELLPAIKTNISESSLLEWVSYFSSKDTITLYGTSGPVEGGIDAATQLWLVPSAPDRWKTLMDVVNAGGDPASVAIQFAGTVESDRAPINSTAVISVVHP